MRRNAKGRSVVPVVIVAVVVFAIFHNAREVAPKAAIKYKHRGFPRLNSSGKLSATERNFLRSGSYIRTHTYTRPWEQVERAEVARSLRCRSLRSGGETAGGRTMEGWADERASDIGRCR